MRLVILITLFYNKDFAKKHKYIFTYRSDLGVKK